MLETLIFVHACRILFLKTVTRDQIKLADAFLLQYCKRVERIYGKDVITPNMHLSCHLSSCVLDYGPLQNCSHLNVSMDY